MKTSIIIRGCSGSGKTTFSNFIKSIVYSFSSFIKCSICTADDYHIENGKYNFNPEKLGWAHRQCQLKFEQSCKNGVNIVICANTNTRHQDVTFYKNLAEKYNYRVFILTIENWNGIKDIHEVPEKTLQKQSQESKNKTFNKKFVDYILNRQNAGNPATIKSVQSRFKEEHLSKSDIIKIAKSNKIKIFGDTKKSSNTITLKKDHK